jgi:hypothetical protein
VNIDLYVCIINILLFHDQSNNPPISTSSSGSSTFAGACWTAGLSSTLAATGADVAAGALVFLI